MHIKKLNEVTEVKFIFIHGGEHNNGTHCFLLFSSSI